MTGRLLFDLTGLLHWYADFRRPGGAQRVIEMAAASDAVRRSGKVEFVARLLGSDHFYRLDPRLLGRLGELRRAHARGLRQATLAGLSSKAATSMRPRPPAGLDGACRLFCQATRTAR